MAEGMVARVGQWCFRRRWWVVAIWVLAVVGGVFAAGPVFRGLTGGGGPSSMESIQANQVLSGNTNMGGMVTAVIDGIDPKAGAVTDTVRAAAGDLVGISGVVSVSTPYDPGLPPARAAALVSRDNHAILVTIQLAKLDKLARHDAAAAVGTRLHKLGDALVSAGQTGAQVRVGGGAALGQQVNDAVQKDLARAEEISLPITLVVLVFVFGGLIAAGLPVLAAIVSAASVMTVLTGLSALGAAGVSIALVAMLVSLTFTAAMIGLARRRIKPSKRAARRIARFGDAAEVGFFARLARMVQRRPLVTALLTGAALVGAGAPLLATSMHLDDVNSFPRSLEAVAVAHELHDRFNVATSPAVVVVARTDPASLDAWATRWTGVAGVSRVAPAEQVGPGLSVVNIDVSGDPEGATARALVDRVRADRPGGGQSWVTGDAAFLNDLLGLLGERLPFAVGVTVLAMVVLLFAMTGSLVVPLKAVVMNVVSLGATFGVMSAVFEHGFLAKQLGLITVAGLNPFVVVIVFAFAFGLSMDYEVFLLGRIKEYVDRGLETDHAVRRGLQNSGRIITSAALLMVIVFGAFGLARTGTIQQVGIGLAVAVAVDATIVRCVLVPATMTLLGRFNWWAPAWLSRLHARVGPRETRRLTTEAQPEPALG